VGHSRYCNCSFGLAGMTRRFPPPWTVDEYNDAYFIVRDNNGQQLAYVYFEEEPGRRSAGKLLSKDEARRIAANIAKLPDLLR
jgi:endo-1,4-beta-D-glucanase Y